MFQDGLRIRHSKRGDVTEDWHCDLNNIPNCVRNCVEMKFIIDSHNTTILLKSFSVKNDNSFNKTNSFFKGSRFSASLNSSEVSEKKTGN